MEIPHYVYERHSVRNYLDRAIEQEKIKIIREEIDSVNRTSGLNIQFIENASNIYNGVFSKFSGWKGTPAAYIALVGADDEYLEEKCGYYGEHLVLFIQKLGLNSCWVGYAKKQNMNYSLKKGEKFLLSIAVGYGANQGIPHRSKSMEKVSDVTNMPEWFRTGLECALLAPTAINQQKFFVTMQSGEAKIVSSGLGPYVKVDLGIVKCHFEIGSGKNVFINHDRLFVKGAPV